MWTALTKIFGKRFITQKRWNENTSDNVTMIRLFDEKTNLLISVKPYFKYLDKTAKSRRKDQIGYLIF